MFQVVINNENWLVCLFMEKRFFLRLINFFNVKILIDTFTSISSFKKVFYVNWSRMGIGHIDLKFSKFI